MKSLIIKLSRASDLVTEIRADIKAAGKALSGARNGSNFLRHIPPPDKQGFLSLYTPEENKKLAQLCLASLVETL
jgi:hypothetical protein